MGEVVRTGYQSRLLDFSGYRLFYQEDNLKELLCMVTCIALAIVIILGIIGLPLVYFIGSANSEWLRQSRGIELPWYRAGFLSVSIEDVGADIDMTDTR